ncbi:MAG: tetratricopeptide repeat protein [Chloroflexi bacterium]|nr:tetratricopeptide repeat protein [Chloroflexota bacterium]
MNALAAYLPQDRLRALARGETLPDRTAGSALFADISGFTPLTEALRDSLGPRRGAEELTRHLDAVYTALIAEIEKYGGSVIGFAGDAITCWFDDAHGQAAPRATASAFALQKAMQAFTAIALPNGSTTALTLKVAVATGSARRFVVGDPKINYLDALAGAAVARTSTGEHLANKGDVLLDEATVDAIGESLTIKEWRSDAQNGERFAVATQFASESNTPALPATSRPPAANKLRVWMHQLVYEREISGQGSFLTEFRPCAVSFVRFVGIDYDADDAQAQLDSFIRQLQGITARYDGAVLQLTIGDKGSYIYVNFGALSAHEDDARRAVRAALELRKKTELQLQMGITQGVMRVGAYGGATRRTYGALGDEVNLAARLMSNAAVGEILLGGQIQKTTANDFVSEPRPPLPMKGKAEPLPVFAVTGERQQRAIRLQEPTYALPMVGREKELQITNDKLDLALEGKGQVIGIVAEAGMGKSRLVAEAIRVARKKGFAGYGGACQSDAVNTPYQTWKSIWSAFFDVDPSAPLKKQIRLLEGEIEDRAPERMQALPLLGILLNLEIPDNDFTKTLEPKYRQSALRALLEDCLRAAAKDEPLLIVIEDLHWIDALSHDLTEELARALSDSRVCFVLAYRPPQLARLEAPRLEAMSNFTRIELHELNATEAEGAIRAKLAQLYPARSGAVPPMLVEKLMARSQGNSFYLEELLNFLRDRGLDPRDAADLNKIELPDSLHTLILSRIDTLTEREKTTLRVASIVGRLFRADWLTGYYPDLGAPTRVQADLEGLAQIDITPLDSPEPELAYLFKHIVTHEVTYESLPFATRAQLHEQLAQYLETIAAPVETIAHHYGQSHNSAKQREYFQKAGDVAQAAFANEAALDHYARLLPLLAEPREQIDLHLKRGDLFSLMGQWAEAETDYHTALALAETAPDPAATARCQQALGALLHLRGDYDAALAWLVQARAGCEALDDRARVGETLIEMGIVSWRKGEYADAHGHLEKGLASARAVGDQHEAARALNILGSVFFDQGDYAAARALYEESLALTRQMGDKRGIAASLNNLGLVAGVQGDSAAAWALYEESLALVREMGDKWGIAICLNNLGSVAGEQGDYAAALALHEESLALRRQIGDKLGIATSFNDLGNVANYQGDSAAARALHEEGLALYREMGDKRGIMFSLFHLGLVAVEQQDYIRARALHAESLTQAREMGEKLVVVYNLAGLAAVAVGVGAAWRAARLAAAAETLLAVIKGTIESLARRQFERTLAAARATLGEEAFNAAWAEGQAMSLDDAIALALTPPE